MVERTQAAIKLLYYVSKCFGTIPFTFSMKEGYFKLQLTAVSTTVCFIILLAIVVPNIYSVHRVYLILNRPNVYQNTPVDIFVRLCVNIFNLLCHLCTPFVLIKNKENLNFALNSLTQNMNFVYERNKYNLFYVVLQLCICLTYLISCSLVYFIVNFIERSGIYNLAYMGSIFAVQLTIFQFVNFYLLIKQCFAYINSEFNNLGQTSEKLVIFQKVVKLHGTMCDVSYMICSTYSPLLLIFLLQIFSWIIRMLYFLILKIMGYKIEESVILYMLVLLYTILQLLLVSYCCHGIELEVSTNII